MRLQSDSAIARDSRTACEWQSFVNNQSKLVSDFQFIFLALTQLGQNPDAMVDCSDVIPISKPAPANTPGFSFFPAGKTMADVEQAVRTCKPCNQDDGLTRYFRSAPIRPSPASRPSRDPRPRFSACTSTHCMSKGVACANDANQHPATWCVNAA